MLSIDKPVVSRQVASMSMNESDFTISFQYNFLYLMRVEQATRKTMKKNWIEIITSIFQTIVFKKIITIIASDPEKLS